MATHLSRVRAGAAVLALVAATLVSGSAGSATAAAHRSSPCPDP
ncbi:TRAP-type C4-dicarboxylate transport system permease large subunit [Hamadaea flava]|nr:TRAP-type C4-dicarboxylate transport system permease large subunit [Hamadaea flava]